MSLDRSPDLDLHEAEQLLELVFFTFENADNQQDWFTMRAPIGSGVLAALQLVQYAQKALDKPGLAGGRTL